jgi:hypothetical protein
MARYRGTREPTASLVGRLILLLAAGGETSSTLAARLGVSARQVNRYVAQLASAGWVIDRTGARRTGVCRLRLVAPLIRRPSPRAGDERPGEP